MQSLEEGKKQPTQNDDLSINFRSSPNFKHMKKYLKSKFEETRSGKSHEEQSKEKYNATEHDKQKSTIFKQERDKFATATAFTVTDTAAVAATVTATVSAVVTTTDARPTATTTVTESTSATRSAPATFQPPLPPNPPPEIKIKQEVIDEDYSQSQYVTSAEMQKQCATPQDMNADSKSEPDNSKGPPMCRNYVRGTCNKGSACIFQHNLILSQLREVFTFCRDYQNRQCTLPRCKFVHASVFEKEQFFRTGYLPKRATNHLKPFTETSQPQHQLPPPPPPPLPPPPPPPEEPPMQHTSAQQGYYAAPTYNASSMPNMGMVYNTMPYMAQNPYSSGMDIYAAEPSTSNATVTSGALKRDWLQAQARDALRETSHTLPEPCTGESLPKRCRNCDSNEFRYQYHKNKVENMISASEEVNKKLSQINSKSQRLCTVLVTLFKSQSSNVPPATVPGMPDFSAYQPAHEDTDNTILNQLNLLLGANTRLPAPTGEDNVASTLASNVNLQNILAQLLMGTSDQPPPQ